MKTKRIDEVKSNAIPSFAFVGKMASGKSTYAEELKLQMEREFSVNVYRVALSAKIIEIAIDLFAMEGKDRLLLEAIGAKMREIDYCVWAKYVVRDALTNSKLPLIADGIRSPQDAALFREGLPTLVIVRIEVDERQRMEAYQKVYGRYPTQEELNMVTEKTAEDIPADVILKNNYYQAELEDQVRDLVNAIRIITVTDALRP